MKIVSFPVDTGGCGWYRVRQPLMAIEKDPNHSIKIISKNDDGISILKHLAEADIIICRPGISLKYTKHRVITQINAYNEAQDGRERLKLHAMWVFDIDDSVETISPYSVHYREYGVKEFYDRHSGVWLWKDGQRGFSIQQNKMRLKELMGSMRDADMVTVTTDLLASYARQFNKRVAVLPNAINLEWWWKLPLKPNKRLRVGWSGGMSHYEDWYTIREPFNKLMREHQFTFATFGTVFNGLIDPDNMHLVEGQAWIPFRGHSYRMMCSALDIAVIPLADLPFNHFKSAVKYLEMSAMGVPSVVADIPPYSKVADNSRAVMYKTPDLFYGALKSLITSQVRRSSVSKSALKFVNDEYSIDKVKDLYLQAYADLMRG